MYFDCALISKWAGGIGLHIHNIRASGSHINGTNGSSNGIVPMLKVFNHTAKYVDSFSLVTTFTYTLKAFPTGDLYTNVVHCGNTIFIQSSTKIYSTVDLGTNWVECNNFLYRSFLKEHNI